MSHLGSVPSTAVPDPVESLDPEALIGCTSRGMLRMPHLAAFLGGRRIVTSRTPGLNAVAGWGGQRSGRKAKRLAHSTMPCLLFEDGFLRSVGLGKSGAASVSVVVDDRGVYTDARADTRLQSLLNAPHPLSGRDLESAERGLGIWRQHRLSKYNTGVEHAPDALIAKRPLILVDQLKGDMSVTGAAASSADFARMLTLALAHRPASDILVRTHPDVASGHGEGYLAAAARTYGLSFVDPRLSSPAVLDMAGEIWTVSSGLGFEAVLRQVPTRVFGAPFYAGWGLTIDDAGPEATAFLGRRVVLRSVEELFAAAFLRLARYADPVSRRPLTYEGAVERIVDWRARDLAHPAATTFCYGFSAWKRRSAAAFLGGSASRVEFVRRPKALLKRATAVDGGRIAVWGMREAYGLGAECRSAAVPLLRVEDGFLRSVGLGSSLRPPGSLVVDDIGIYYDAHRPSRLEMLIEAGEFAPDLIARAQRLRAKLAAQRMTKYNLEGSCDDLRGTAGGRPILLVVEQVPSDASLLHGGGASNSALDLLRHVRSARPDAYLVYKEHPDLVSGNRLGRQPRRKLAAAADLVVSTGDLGTVFDEVDEVHTLSSLAGFEALVRGIQVHAWGRPFYAGWGLTVDAFSFERRTRKATVDEVIAAALILYPRYVDPSSLVPCSVEDYVDALIRMRATDPAARRPEPANQVRRLFRYLKAVGATAVWPFDPRH